MFKSIRIVVAIVTFYDYEICQVDVKITFLKGKLDDDVYVKQHQILKVHQMAKRMFKLRRVIHG